MPEKQTEFCNVARTFLLCQGGDTVTKSQETETVTTAKNLKAEGISCGDLSDLDLVNDPRPNTHFLHHSSSVL